jgi:hypothetical protein
MFIRLMVILAAVAAAVMPLPAEVVERWYSTGLYPRLQAFLTPLSNDAPFALLDALIVVFVAAWLGAIVIDRQRTHAGWLRLAGRTAVRTVVWSAALYLAFLAVWGLNYRRTKLADRLEFNAEAISASAALSVAGTSVRQANALFDASLGERNRPSGSGDQLLVSAFDAVQGELGVRPPAAAGRPKRTGLDLYFRRAGVAGMTDPYFLETIVATDLLPFERPFVVAHEWGHLAGFADESEASFVGWLTCLRGSPNDQYSGWLFLYTELSGIINARDRGALLATLAPGPRADLEAVARRLRAQVSPGISSAGWRLYDRYLKANRVDKGAASYGEIVRLVLGVRFGPEWTPLKKGTHESTR